MHGAAGSKVRSLASRADGMGIVYFLYYLHRQFVFLFFFVFRFGCICRSFDRLSHLPINPLLPFRFKRRGVMARALLKLLFFVALCCFLNCFFSLRCCWPFRGVGMTKRRAFSFLRGREISFRDTVFACKHGKICGALREKLRKRFFFSTGRFFSPCFLCVLCALGDSAGGGGGVRCVIGGKPLEGGYCWRVCCGSGNVRSNRRTCSLGGGLQSLF